MAKQRQKKRQWKRWGLAIGLIVIFAIAAGWILLVSDLPRTPAPNPSLPASYAHPKTAGQCRLEGLLQRGVPP